jgi:GNAT superfamily N-acetyltransferase
VRRIPDEVQVLGAFDGPRFVGATVYYGRLNWLMGTVVTRDHRRRGVATALVRALADRLRGERASIRLINVDRSDVATLAFAQALGFAPLISQYEMELRLG